MAKTRWTVIATSGLFFYLLLACRIHDTSHGIASCGGDDTTGDGSVATDGSGSDVGCGDGTCDGTETCDSCSTDCGVCSSGNVFWEDTFESPSFSYFQGG